MSTNIQTAPENQKEQNGEESQKDEQNPNSVEKIEPILSFPEWIEQQSFYLVITISLLIGFLLPFFHILEYLDGVPVESRMPSLILRLIGAGISFSILFLVLFFKPLRKHSPLFMSINVFSLLTITGSTVVLSGNYFLYISAGLLSVFGSSFGFMRPLNLILSYALSFIFYATFTYSQGGLNDFTGIASVLTALGAYIISVAFGLVRIRSMHNEFKSKLALNDKKEELNEALEKLQKSIYEQKMTLELVQALKMQQDADYYLTSILIKPLGLNTVSEGPLKVTSFVKQHKQFAFKKWIAEIGGDICISHSLKLRGRTHTLFLNADAMGKSIQGAGGSLVLGAVSQAIIERTRLSQSIQNQFPERWIKNSFVELHKVFESFDGSMLISLSLGLVDDESGLMYFLSAEHPSLVLYRDGKASFIEDEDNGYRKLGTPDLTGAIQVYLFQMLPGDVVIAGSDGRDDVIIGEYAPGRVQINEDETEFLRRVEEGKGEIADIYSAILTKGELKDDISLMRLEYQPESPNNPTEYPLIPEETQEEIKAARASGDAKELVRVLENARDRGPNNSPEIVTPLLNAYIRTRQYQKVISLAEEILAVNPGRTESIYVASYAYKKLSKFEIAADYGERVRLRDPHHLKNLVNLGQIYLCLNRYERAQQLVKDGLQLDPENLKLKEIDRILERKMALPGVV